MMALFDQVTDVMEGPEPLDEALVQHLDQVLSGPSIEKFSEKEKNPDHPASIVKALISVFSFVQHHPDEAFIPTGPAFDKNDRFTRSGSYFVRDQERQIRFVFKPVSEEKGQGLPGFKPGAAAKKEQVAYLLAKRQKVPVPTTLYVNLGGRIGSLQRFVPSTTHLALIRSGPPHLVHKISPLDIQSIALFDGRIRNGDRHSLNILAKETDGYFRLTAIDHASAFGADSDGPLYIDYYNIPQMNGEIDSQVVENLLAVNLASDAALMKKHGFSQEQITWVTKSTLFLQMALKKNHKVKEEGLKPLTLRDLLSYLKISRSLPQVTSEQMGYLLNILVERKQTPQQ